MDVTRPLTSDVDMNLVPPDIRNRQCLMFADWGQLHRNGIHIHQPQPFLGEFDDGISTQRATDQYGVFRCFHHSIYEFLANQLLMVDEEALRGRGEVTLDRGGPRDDEASRDDRTARERECRWGEAGTGGVCCPT